jgi:hypothetical protein
VPDRLLRALLWRDKGHLAHHHGEFEISAQGAGRFTFRHPDGKVLPTVVPRVVTDAPGGECVPLAHPTPEWDGTRLDRAYAISVFAETRSRERRRAG